MKNIIKVFLGTMSLTEAITTETNQVRPELLVSVSDIELLQLDDEEPMEVSFQFIQTSDEAGLYMKRPVGSSFIQYN